MPFSFRQGIDLGYRFLNPVLAEPGQTDRVGGKTGLQRLTFGDGEDRDPVRIAPGRLDAPPDRGQPARDRLAQFGRSATRQAKRAPSGARRCEYRSGVSLVQAP